MNRTIKRVALMASAISLFSCNKEEVKTTDSNSKEIENVMGKDLLAQIEKVNVANNDLVLGAIEELKEENTSNTITYDDINQKIEENSVLFKSSNINRNFVITTHLEILDKYGKLLSNRLVNSLKEAPKNTEKEELLSLFEKEKNIFVDEILSNTSLKDSEKKDIITFILLSNAKLLTEISVLDEVDYLVNGKEIINTKGFWNNLRNWFERRVNDITRITQNCAFGVAATVVGGASYATGVGAAVGTSILGAGLPRLGFCFQKRR
jgi:lipoprotein